MSYAAVNLRTRLERFEARRRAPSREFSELERSVRLASILAGNDNDDTHPRHVRMRELHARIRAIVQAATLRAAFSDLA